MTECKHDWETIEKRKVLIGTVGGNGIFGNLFESTYGHYKIVYTQKCNKCGMIHQTK